MMEWIGDQVSAQASGSMGDALLERAALLREQLSDGQGPQSTDPDKIESTGVSQSPPLISGAESRRAVRDG
jgi:hypothetical protein